MMILDGKFPIRFFPCVLPGVFLWGGICLVMLEGFISPGSPAFAEQAGIAAWYKNSEIPSAEGIATIRDGGATGLAELFKEYDTVRGALKSPAEQREFDLWADRWLDRVCAQHLCRYSRLYWYTNLPKALAESRKQGKPLIRLRLLGDLRDELSCANSRFFKTLLYPTQAVSELLRTKFILYWDSERPVPKVTVDFSDGREILTTVTGNSIHYVMDSQGRLIDALPGLYDPVTFVEQLVKVDKLSHEVSNLLEADFLAALYRYHTAALGQLDQDWEKVLNPGRSKADQVSRKQLEKEEVPPRSPDAAAASARAITKSVSQSAVVAAVSTSREETRLNRSDIWKSLADRYLQGDPVTQNARTLIETELYSGSDAFQPDFEKFYAKLKSNIALDTVRNEFLLHAQLHRWLSAGSMPADFDQLNTKVYKDLFFSPKEDPWMGLVKNDTFNGIRNSGIVAAEHEEETEPTREDDETEDAGWK